MKVVHIFERKSSRPAAAGSPREGRDRDRKKPGVADRPARDQPPARAHTELPRASTIPPYPKQRVDD